MIDFTEGALNELSASHAVDLMRSGQVRAREYAAELLAVARDHANLNAFVTLDEEAVMSAAAEADAARAAGRPLGRLHGLPVPGKDSINVAGMPSGNGTRALRGFRPARDAAIVTRLRAEGAFVMGKTAMNELSCGWTGNDGIVGFVRNPHDTSRIAGGSSSGSAAAVSAGAAPLALGEDTIGSIRVPASCCGIVGFRPSVGRYPCEGVTPMMSGVDQVGTLARTVADISFFDDVLGPPDEGARTELDPEDLRIGVCPGDLGRSLAPDVARVQDEAVERLRRAGVTLVEIALPEALDAAEIALGIWGFEVVGAIDGFLRAQDAPVDFERLLLDARDEALWVFRSFALPPRRPSREAYAHLLSMRDRLRRTITDRLTADRVDALLFPVIPVAPTRIGDDAAVTLGGRELSLFSAMSRNVSLASCADMPSLALPAGTADSGVPIGLELAGLSGNDRRVLRIGHAIEHILTGNGAR